MVHKALIPIVGDYTDSLIDSPHIGGHKAASH